MSEEKVMFGDAAVYLTALSVVEYMRITDPIVTSVHAFPLGYGGEVMFTVNPRGLDIIGGHVEPGETHSEAIRREVFEEACIDALGMYLLGAIRVDNRDNPKGVEKGYPLIGYQLFFAIDDYRTHPFEARFECTGREFVHKDEVAKRHHNWLGVHQAMLDKI
jgi:8-oxo-dGTP pyrophosphatase MutT (NUDIX family)